MSDWDVTPLTRNVHRIDWSGIKSGWEARVLLRGDAHHDSPLNDEKKELSHLKMAQEMDAPIIDDGDLFDVMGGKKDPRRSESGIKPQHKVDHYFDAVREDAYEFYKPFANQFAVLSEGNHETAVKRHHNIDLTGFMSKRLQEHAPNRAYNGLYGGYVFFRFHVHGTVTHTIRMKRHHGTGGSAPVTKGVIKAQRRSIYYSDADLVTTGHIHDGWLTQFRHETVSDQGVVSRRVQYHISIPGYKGDPLKSDNAEGWEIEKEFEPAITGAWWLIFRYQPYDTPGVPPIKMSFEPLDWS